ncbi:MAG: hypothetical protein KF893_10560 [Caldilineaceae bacterium]|nr:hypothetical protein [Caldilineaceae bacterium]
MSGLSQRVTIEEFQQLMGSDTQKVPAFLRKIANTAKPEDVRMLKASVNSDVTPATSWVGWF